MSLGLRLARWIQEVQSPLLAHVVAVAPAGDAPGDALCAIAELCHLSSRRPLLRVLCLRYQGFVSIREVGVALGCRPNPLCRMPLERRELKVQQKDPASPDTGGCPAGAPSGVGVRAAAGPVSPDSPGLCSKVFPE